MNESKQRTVFSFKHNIHYNDNEKDLFKNKFNKKNSHISHSNEQRKTRNHLPSIDITHNVSRNRANMISNNTISSITVSKLQPLTCKNQTIIKRHQYSNSLSTQISLGKNYYDLEYSLHNTYSQFLLGSIPINKNGNKYIKKENFDYFTFVPSSKKKKYNMIKRNQKSETVDNNRNYKERERNYYKDKEEYMKAIGVRPPYQIANAIREQYMRKLHKRKLDDIEIKPDADYEWKDYYITNTESNKLNKEKEKKVLNADLYGLQRKITIPHIIDDTDILANIYTKTHKYQNQIL